MSMDDDLAAWIAGPMTCSR
jgi:hypothetical protein